MKLKKLLKYIDDDTYIKIGAYGYCQCNCKKSCAQDIIEKFKDYKVSSIDGGKVLLAHDLDIEYHVVTIYLKDKEENKCN